jgi:hypothetical protein
MASPELAEGFDAIFTASTMGFLILQASRQIPPRPRLSMYYFVTMKTFAISTN